MRRLLVSAAIGIFIIIGLFWLISMAKDISDTLYKFLFAWREMEGWLKVYFLIGSAISICSVGYFVKEFLIDNPEEWIAKNRANSRVIHKTAFERLRVTL